MQALNTGASEAALRQDLEAAITFINEHILNDVEGLRPAKVQALRDAITAAQDVLANEDATADQLKQARPGIDQGSPGIVGDRLQSRAERIDRSRKWLP